jgi:hypothetical protein
MGQYSFLGMELAPPTIFVDECKCSTQEFVGCVFALGDMRLKDVVELLVHGSGSSLRVPWCIWYN